MRYRPKIWKTSALVAVFCIGGIGIILSQTNLVRRFDDISSNPNGFIRHFSPTWRSIKRIVDLPFFLFYSSRTPSVLVYELTISKKDKAALLDNLPDYPQKTGLTEEYKKSIKGEFHAGNYYTDDAKIRYRGVSANHWNATKKSWQVNLPNDKPLGSRTDLRFFLPEDKGWVIGVLNAYRAQKLGLITPEISYVRLVVNKIDMGVYLLIEGWEESMLERNGYPLAPFYSNKNLDTHSLDLMKPESLDFWENRLQKQIPTSSSNELAYFLSVIANTTDEEFKSELPLIVDIDKLYRWILASILSGSLHQGNGANQNWYFDPATGKFQPILFDVALAEINGPMDLSYNRLVNRVLQTEAFRRVFMEKLRKYVSDEKNLTDDIAFFDRKAKEMRPEMLSDTKKILSSFEVLQRIREERRVIIHNFKKLATMSSQGDNVLFRYAPESYPLSQSVGPKSDFEKSFQQTFISSRDFVLRNPQFSISNPSTIILPRGVHIFTKNVIVPRSYKLIIESGATLLFNPQTSLISYSSIKAVGTPTEPIIMKARYADSPWGVFAIVGTEGKNIFEYTQIENGSDATINALYFSGNLSVHGSDLEFTDGLISSSRADDGIHVMRGKANILRTHFIDTSSDGIDIDYARGADSLVAENIFERTGGDSIDVSFSHVTIKDNSILGCGDKGVSVGEASHSLIQGNTFVRCLYGVAVKDRSEATIENNIFVQNKTGVGLYRKKPHFVLGGTARVKDSVFWDNDKDISSDEYSKIDVTESVLESNFPGIGNTTTAPDFKAILSLRVYQFITQTPRQ